MADSRSPPIFHPSLLIAVIILAVLVPLSRSGSAWLVHLEQKARLTGHLNALNPVIARLLSQGDTNAIRTLFAQPKDQTRLTVVLPDGQPLADTHFAPSALTNFSDWEEFRQAVAHGEGWSQRSRGLQRKELILHAWQAIPGEDGRAIGYLRATQPTAVVDARQKELFRILMLRLSSGSLAAGLVFLLVQRQRARPVKQLLANLERVKQGDYRFPVHMDAAHPFSPIAGTVNQLVEEVEKQLRTIMDQRHQQQVLLHSMSDGILVLDQQRNVMEMNTNARTWLDAAPSNGRPRDLAFVCRNPALLDFVDQLITSRRSCDADIQIHRAGTLRILHLRGTLMIDADRMVGALIVIRDVTALRRLETMRRDFVANVSHELRTPLTSIHGFAELIRDNPEDAGMVLDAADRILRQSGRMTRLVEDLLDLARIEAGGENTRLAMLPVAELLREVVHLEEEAARKRRITIVLDAGEELRAPMSAPLVEQAVFNLLHNAVKYTHENSVVTLRAFNQDEHLVIQVQDEGPGIEPQHHARLFERFYRVDKARSRAAGGTGLGLSIVKHVAQLHHGTVEVDSDLGRGSTFSLRLPLREPA